MLRPFAFFLKKYLPTKNDLQGNKRCIRKVEKPSRVPQRKAFIDEDTDLITTVESHERLIKLQIVLAIISSITSSILLLSQRQHLNQQLYQHVSKSNSLSFTLPKIAIIDQVGNGTLVKYWIDKNHTLHYDCSLKLPSPKVISNFALGSLSKNYFAFVENKEVVIIAEDGYKDTTIVYSNSSHRKIPNSKYPFKRRIGSTSVRTSKYFWIFDGHEPLEMNHHGMPWNWILKGSYLWAIEKQKYLLGPSVPQEMPLSIGGSCSISLNRSHVLVLFLTHDLDYEGFFHIFGYGCLAGWTYDFDNWKWSNLHWCIKGFEMEVFTKLSCTSYFTKHFQLLIMMWVSKTSDPAFTSDHKVTIAKSDSGEIVQHVLIQNSGIISEFGSTQKN